LNPDIIIVARASSQEAKNKLRKAGANRIITPEIIGARRMATMVLQPAVCDFLDGILKTETLEMELAEIEVKHGSRIEDMSIKDASKEFDFGALIISIVDSGDRLSLIKASGTTVLRAGHKLIAIGTKDQIQQLNNISYK
jgi:voltage-gated potassium channel